MITVPPVRVYGRALCRIPTSEAIPRSRYQLANVERAKVGTNLSPLGHVFFFDWTR